MATVMTGLPDPGQPVGPPPDGSVSVPQRVSTDRRPPAALTTVSCSFLPLGPL